MLPQFQPHPSYVKVLIVVASYDLEPLFWEMESQSVEKNSTTFVKDWDLFQNLGRISEIFLNDLQCMYSGRKYRFCVSSNKIGLWDYLNKSFILVFCGH